ncbi:MAG: putative metal-binding motif-containing protein, partial [Myxococcota bacterium]
GPEAETCGDLNDSDCDGGDDTVGCTTVGPAEHCGNAAPVPADGRIAGTFATTTNEIEGNCTSDDPEVVYTFDIPDDGTSYEARVRYFGQSNNAVLVRPPESCGDQYGSQAICDFFDENWQFMTPGTHVLIIEGNALDSYDVRVELRNDVQQCLIPATDDADADGVGACADEPDCDDADATVFPGAPEACTGIDNDCNNLVDDIDVACDTGLPGICGEGREICVGSGSTLCEQTQLQQTELCDNLDDDDCDGFTDAADPEGCEVVPPGACDAPLSLPLDDTTAIDLSSGLPLEDCQCACGPELPSLVFAFTLDAASPNWEVQFDAPGAPPGTEFELVEGTTCDSANGIACFSGNDNLGLPPGDYVLIVTSVDPMALSPFDLTVTATPI